MSWLACASSSAGLSSAVRERRLDDEGERSGDSGGVSWTTTHWSPVGRERDMSKLWVPRVWDDQESLSGERGLSNGERGSALRVPNRPRSGSRRR
ncbi:hypothetical protein EXIGLDRAFT_719593 [Exidia glandulosa HHB12029]|uniref:Uncharacterized protein n=1 Tax=Exidia glandulosa HHB12029 TaxID=1314781 RepID=A0A166AEU3_EXIGL|nr:hypothetical protein EXIGLDRAFT_719593 [Exidia glandulosa HHB12029]